MKKQIGYWMLSLAIIGFCSSSVEAQNPTGGTVSCTGSVTLRPKVESLRVQVQLAAQAATLDEALSRLKVRREAAMQKLSELGAEKEATEIGKIGMSKWSGMMAANFSPCTPTSVPSPSTGNLMPPPIASTASPFVPFDPYATPGTPPSSSETPAENKPTNSAPPGMVEPKPSAPVGTTAIPTTPPSATGGWSGPVPSGVSATPSYPSTTPPVAGYATPGPVAYPSAASPYASPPSAPPPSASYVTPGPTTYSIPFPTIRPPYENKTYYTVTSSLSADWKLSGESQEDMLKEVEKLKEKIEAADLTGLKNAKNLPPEEEMLRTSALNNIQTAPAYGSVPCITSCAPCATTYGVYGVAVSPVSSDEQNQSSVPVISYPSTVYPFNLPQLNLSPKFHYVVRISEEQRKAATAEAFAKAKAYAAELADASGSKLGSIQTVKLDLRHSFFAGSRILYGSEPTPPAALGWNALPDEILCEKDDAVIQVQITAVFRLE